MSESMTSVALTIAGSDSGGGAGIQADLKTFAAMGCFGASALTAVTAQNTVGVQAAYLLEPGLVAGQIESVATDMKVRATKVGMLGSAAIIEVVADALEAYELGPVVLDPVMVAKSGDALIDDSAVAVLIDRLLPRADLVTPNRREAARLLGLDEPISTVTAATVAAERICERLGARACVVKGVRRSRHQHEEMVDVAFDGRSTHELSHPWRGVGGLHGSGCCFSAAVTAALALGADMAGALERAKRFIHVAVSGAVRLGGGSMVVNPQATGDL